MSVKFQSVSAGTGVGYQSFPYPTPEEYVQGAVQGVGTMLDFVSPQSAAAAVQQTAEIIPKPVKDSLVTLSIGLEKETGVGIDQLMSLSTNLSKLGSKNPMDVIAAVDGLITGTIGIAQDLLQGAGVNAGALAAGAGAALLGLDMIFTALSAPHWKKALQAACDREVREQVLDWCRTSRPGPKPTGTSSAPRPCDLFQVLVLTNTPLAILNTASMFVALCGDESGSGRVTDTMEVAGIGRLQTAYKESGGQIPQAIQRKMWTLIKGIMKAVVPTSALTGPEYWTDGGAALFPMLLELVTACGKQGYITIPGEGVESGESTLELLSKAIGRQVTRQMRCARQTIDGSTEAAGKLSTASCEHAVNLAKPVAELLRQYNTNLSYCYQNGFAQPPTCEMETPSEYIGGDPVVGASLVATRIPAAAKNIDKIIASRGKLSFKRGAAGPVVTTAAAAGAGWLLWKYLLKGVLL